MVNNKYYVCSNNAKVFKSEERRIKNGNLYNRACYNNIILITHDRRIKEKKLTTIQDLGA